MDLRTIFGEEENIGYVKNLFIATLLNDNVMKKTLLYLILLGLIAAVSYWFLSQQKSSTISDTEKAFNVQDTASIQKILIHHPTKPSIELNRKDDRWWTVNSKWIAIPGAVDNVLETIYKMRVDRPISKGARTKIKNATKERGIKVEVFTEKVDQASKTFYVGATTNKQLGNYMLLEGAEDPYIVHIPGFNGILAPRFFSGVENWRHRPVFDYYTDKIKEIKLDYPEQAAEGFTLKVANDGNFQVLNHTGNDPKVPSDPIDAKIYLNSFKDIYAEAYQNDFSKRDSIEASSPYCKMSIKDANGAVKEITIYHMPRYERSKMQYDDDGAAVKYDVDRYFASINEGRDFVIIQKYVFGKLFKKYQDFVKAET